MPFVPSEPSAPPGPAAPARRLRRLLGPVVALLVVGFLVLAVVAQWRELREVDLRLSPGWLALALLAIVGFQALHGEIAVQVTRGLGQAIPARRVRAIFAASLMARYVPTGALAVVARLSLGERAGMPKRVATVGLLYETALAVGAGGVVSLTLLSRASPWLAVAAVVVASGVLVVGLSPMAFQRVADLVLVRIGRDPLPVGLTQRRVIALLGVAVVSFLLAGVSVLCAVRAVVAVPDQALMVILASAGLGFVTSMLGFALPGGLGAREAGIAGALVLVMPGPLAVAIAVVCRILQTAAELGYAAAVGYRARGAAEVAQGRPSTPDL